MTGQTLGHYRILDKLGAGGMGEVYRAEDTTLDREVALKILPPELAESQERLERFQREAKTLAALDHPNIVTVFTVEQAEDVHFLTMQLVEGKPLSQLIPRAGMPLERIFEIAISLADALATAHEKGVIHRDLKPANIMVTNEGRVKVLDFGLAKLRQEAEAPLATELPTEPLTKEGTIVGTMPYMSPEQLEGKEVDARSDVFSLGVVLYEMATGERPFTGESSASLIMSIGRDVPPAVDTVREELPHHLARVIAHCVEKSPKRRYQSAIDVHNELDALKKEVESGVVQPSSADKQVTAAPHGRRWWPFMAGGAIVFLALVALWFGRRQPHSEQVADAPGKPSLIVVLPFENLGAPEDEYFADGMTEEISSRLAVASGLRVISRTSAMQYKQNRPSLKQIGEELGVEYVLEGSVRWAPSDGSNRVRITPQLIRVEDDSHLWADSYDRVIEDVFEIQSDIASRVVQQLGVTLQAPEQREIEARPTDSLEAYQAYLRGTHFERLVDYSAENRQKVIESLSLATKLDPDFAVAHAALADAHSFYYRLGYDTSEERQELAGAAADRAMALDPASPKVLYGVGYYYYYLEQNYDLALANFNAAAEMRPNDADVIAATAYVWRRQGRRVEGLDRLKRALELSPREASLAAQVGEFAMELRDYPQALEYFNVAIDLAPDALWPYLQKCYIHILWRGDLAASRRVLEAVPESLRSSAEFTFTWFFQTRLERAFQESSRVLEILPHDYWISGQSGIAPIDLHLGQIHHLMGDSKRARLAFEEARVDIESKLQEHPNDFRLHAALGRAYAGLGSKPEAIEHGTKAVELQPVSRDAYIGPRQLEYLAEIYTWVGEMDLAVEQLERVLAIPCDLSVHLLHLDPRWDPLRDHPRFQALLEKYG